MTGLDVGINEQIIVAEACDAKQIKLGLRPWSYPSGDANLMFNVMRYGISE